VLLAANRAIPQRHSPEDCLLALIARRLVQSVAVLAIAAFEAFALARYAGDPVENLIGPDATVADRAALVRTLRLDDPVPDQYARFVAKALAGDLGVSFRHGRPVAGLIAERLPATLTLAAISTVLALARGIALVVAATGPTPLFARVFFWAAIAVAAIPSFLTAILLVWVFAAGLRGGWLDTIIMPFVDLQLALPAVLVAMLVYGVVRAAMPPAARDGVGLAVVVAAIALSEWVLFARLARALVRIEKEKAYISAAHAIGVGRMRGSSSSTSCRTSPARWPSTPRPRLPWRSRPRRPCPLSASAFRLRRPRSAPWLRPGSSIFSPASSG